MADGEGVGKASGDACAGNQRPRRFLPVSADLVLGGSPLKLPVLDLTAEGAVILGSLVVGDP